MMLRGRSLNRLLWRVQREKVSALAEEEKARTSAVAASAASSTPATKLTFSEKKEYGVSTLNEQSLCFPAA